LKQQLSDEVFLPERGWVLAGKPFKGFSKIRNVFKAAFKACFGDRFVLHQYLFRLVDAKLIQKVGESIMS